LYSGTLGMTETFAESFVVKISLQNAEIRLGFIFKGSGYEGRQGMGAQKTLLHGEHLPFFITFTWTAVDQLDPKGGDYTFFLHHHTERER
jgi:hypothetical protein